MVDMAATADPLKRKENYYCFICGNVFDKENEKQVKMFSVTKSRIDSWQQVIQKRGLKIGSKLCSKHFDKEDILDGKYLSGPLSGPFYNYKVTKLTTSAFPKYHLSCLSSSTSFRCQKTKQKVKSVNGKDLLDNKASRRPLSIIRPIVNAQHQSGYVSAHGKQEKRCNTIVAVKKGSTLEKPIVNNPIPMFVEDFDYEMCELSLLNKDTSTCSQPTEVSLETNLHLEEIGDQQLDLQDVGARLLDIQDVGAPQMDLRDVTAPQSDLRDVTTPQLDLRDITAPQLDLRDVGASKLDLRNVTASQLDLRDVTARQLDLQDVEASQVDLRDVGANQLDLSINLLDTQPLQVLGNYQKCIFSKKRKKKCKKNSYTPKRSSCSKCVRFVTSTITSFNISKHHDHEDVLPFLIMEYVQIRFHFESTRYRNNFFASYNSQVRTNKKIAKNV